MAKCSWRVKIKWRVGLNTFTRCWTNLILFTFDQEPCIAHTYISMEDTTVSEIMKAIKSQKNDKSLDSILAHTHTHEPFQSHFSRWTCISWMPPWATFSIYFETTSSRTEPNSSYHSLHSPTISSSYNPSCFVLSASIHSVDIIIRSTCQNCLSTCLDS